LRIFQQGLVQLGTQFGEILLPMFQKAMERLNGILTSITKLSPETKKFALGLGMLVSALGPTVLLIGKASIAVGKLMGSIKKLDKATLILRLKILAITAVIAGLVTAILYVKENFDSFAIFFQNLWNGIKRFVLEAVATISSKIAGLLERVGFDDASAKMKGFIDGVNKSLESIPEGKETNFQSIGEFIDSLTGKAKELISSLTEIGVASEDLPDPSERFDTQSAGRADMPSAT
jgi:phage-related minor tail protein